MYAALVIAGLAFVRVGLRRLFWVPAVLFVALPLLASQGFLPVLDFFAAWRWPFATEVAFDFAMILIPVTVAARFQRGEARALDAWHFAGSALSLSLLLLIVLQRQAVTEGSLYFHGYGVRLLGTSFAVGVALGFRRRLLFVGIPFVLLVSGATTYAFQWLTVPNTWGPEGPMPAIWSAVSGPAAAIACGALGEPAARMLRKRRRARAAAIAA
jgi:hypothetical protein